MYKKGINSLCLSSCYEVFYVVDVINWKVFFGCLVCYNIMIVFLKDLGWIEFFIFSWVVWNLKIDLIRKKNFFFLIYLL